VFQADPILQNTFVDPPWAFRNGDRLPGTSPVDADRWLYVDDAYSLQMALRDRLIAEVSNRVYAITDLAQSAAVETLEASLNLMECNEKYAIDQNVAVRPDGVRVDLNWDEPLLTLGALVQEDICVLQRQGNEHVLTAAILCFPASWTLTQKMGRPLSGIHDPVDEYDSDLTARVQRLFDGLQPGRVIRRANCLEYNDYSLFQPRLENARRDKTSLTYPYIRTERQCLLKLPKSRAVVFSIHTSVLEKTRLLDQDSQVAEQYLARHRGAFS